MQTVSLPVSHFDLDQIANSGQVFRWERVDDHSYLLLAGRRAAVASQQRPDTLWLTCSPDETAFWRHYLALDDDYASFWEIIDHWAHVDGPDAYLTRAARAANGIRILHQDPFETIVSFIISQNNNIPRIRGILNNLCQTFGAPIESPRQASQNTLYAFPAPKALCQTAQLSAMGLGYRDRYVAGAAICFAQTGALGADLLAMECDEARRYLLTLQGVGPKVADCILLFGLGHLDAFPRDVWIKRILNREFPSGFPLSRYAGFAGLLQQLIFFYERQEQRAPRAV